MDNGRNGYIDDLIGWDFIENDNDPMDIDGHGTHTSGTIGAVGNNGLGVVGFNWKVQIMALKFHQLTHDVASPAAAIYYSADNGARISNNSYAAAVAGLHVPHTRSPDRAPQFIIDEVRAAVAYAESRGQLFIAAAGNYHSNNDLLPQYPASFDLPNVIAVAATTKHDTLASFSNYGPTSVDLGAPGDSIRSTWIDGKYHMTGGTSMATPHVAGAAALILARNPNLTYAQVKALILATVDPLPDLAGRTVTGGRLNVFKAVSATPQLLLASSVGHGSTATLTATQVTPVLTEAFTRWQSTGVDTSALRGIDIRIADLGGTTLGLASGNTIWLDDNAAGWSWFVDPTPGDDAEFTTPGNQGEQNRMDLLTVLTHEIGHLLGYEHEQVGAMQETMSAGERLTPQGGYVIEPLMHDFDLRDYLKKRKWYGWGMV